MNIQTLKELVSNKLNQLNSLLSDAKRDGDIERVISLETEISEATNTLKKLENI